LRRYPLDRKLGGPQSWSGHFGGEVNSLVPIGIRTPARPVRSLVDIPSSYKPVAMRKTK
jgi:hypothetical protein